MSNDPSKALSAVTAMREDFDLIDDLLGGTKSMRASGVRHLPKFPSEEQDVYDARLKASTLLPALSKTVEAMTGRVFADAIVLGDDVPPNIQTLTENIDLQGNNLQVWAADFFAKGLAYGLCHVLVDHPRSEGVKTLADEKRLGVRPYAVIINPKQVIGWRFSAGVLTKFRYFERVDDGGEGFDEVMVDQIRVLEPGAWSVYRKDSKGQWLLHESGVTSLSIIPLVSFYTKRTGVMTAVPPLLDLANLNVKHWQSQSDQDNILHVARVPILFLAGFDSTDPVTLGSGSALRHSSADAKASYVEHSGAAIEAGRNALKDLLEEMRMAGAQLLQRDKQTIKTATQAEEEAAQEMSPLERMSIAFADALSQVLQLMAMWQGQPEGGHVEVRGNFDVDFAPEVSLPSLISMANAGKLSSETLFSECQRRGIISDEITWEDERGRIESEGPDMSSLPPLPENKPSAADELIMRELGNGG